jgi:TDG/mug DNA glycosylase family protein
MTLLPPLRDRIRPGVRVLFVGINPGIRSSLTGHHFAGFSNRFWKLLYESKLVPEPIRFVDDDRLPEWGYGVTNIIARPTPGIDTLLPHEYGKGRARLKAKIRRYRPDIVAMVGVTVFRAMFPERRGAVSLGMQEERVGESAVFVLPNPSGRNANFTYAEMLGAFRALKRYLASREGSRRTPMRRGPLRSANLSASSHTKARSSPPGSRPARRNRSSAGPRPRAPRSR